VIEGIISTVFLGPSDTDSNQCSYINKSTERRTCTIMYLQFIVAIGIFPQSK